MLSKASRLALAGLFLSVVAAAPALALAQSDSPGEAPPRCLRTIDFRSGATAAAQPAADPRCGPRERSARVGWLDHAIMLVGDSASRMTARATPAAAWQPSRPAFAVPPAYR